MKILFIILLSISLYSQNNIVASAHESYTVGVIDAFNGVQINPYNFNDYINDGVHLNKAGMAKLSSFIYSKF